MQMRLLLTVCILRKMEGNNNLIPVIAMISKNNIYLFVVWACSQNMCSEDLQCCEHYMWVNGVWHSCFSIYPHWSYWQYNWCATSCGLQWDTNWNNKYCSCWVVDGVRDDTARDSALLSTHEEEEEISSVRYCLFNIVNGSDMYMISRWWLPANLLFW